MVSMAIMVASFRHSLDDWLVSVLPADLYVRSGAAGDSAFFSADDQRKFAGLPGVRRVEFLRVQSVLVDPAQPRVALLARDLPADDPARALPLVAQGPARVRGRSAAGMGERSGGRSLRLPPGPADHAAARRARCRHSPSPACGATMRGNRARSSSTARCMRN